MSYYSFGYYFSIKTKFDLKKEIIKRKNSNQPHIVTFNLNHYKKAMYLIKKNL